MATLCSSSSSESDSDQADIRVGAYNVIVVSSSSSDDEEPPPVRRLESKIVWASSSSDLADGSSEDLCVVVSSSSSEPDLLEVSLCAVLQSSSSSDDSPVPVATPPRRRRSLRLKSQPLLLPHPAQNIPADVSDLPLDSIFRTPPPAHQRKRRLDGSPRTYTAKTRKLDTTKHVRRWDSNNMKAFKALQIVAACCLLSYPVDALTFADVMGDHQSARDRGVTGQRDWLAHRLPCPRSPGSPRKLNVWLG